MWPSVAVYCKRYSCVSLLQSRTHKSLLVDAKERDGSLHRFQPVTCLVDLPWGRKTKRLRLKESRVSFSAPVFSPSSPRMEKSPSPSPWDVAGPDTHLPVEEEGVVVVVRVMFSLTHLSESVG